MAKQLSTVATTQGGGTATGRRRSARTPAQGKKREKLQAAFLTAFRASCTVTQAAKTAGVGRRTHYDWLKADTSYQAQFADLEEEVTETLEREAMRRASEGTLKPVFYQGKTCGTIREYSDTFLIFLLKARRPETYRERSDVNSTVRGTLRMIHELPNDDS